MDNHFLIAISINNILFTTWGTYFSPIHRILKFASVIFWWHPQLYRPWWMAKPDSGCGVCYYGFIPCGCFLDCVSEAVCCASEKCGWGEGIDEFKDVFAVHDVSGDWGKDCGGRGGWCGWGRDAVVWGDFCTGEWEEAVYLLVIGCLLYRTRN